MTEETTLQRIRERFPAAVISEFRGQHRVGADPATIHDLLEFLKDEIGLTLLVDITCVDYLYYSGAKDRFGLVYLLANPETSERITVRTFVNDPDPEVPSATDLWEGANWLEREVWDMFGIRFAGHPDLRRILLPESFEAHPLRKDYPLQGLGERHHLPIVTRDMG
ncbi:MAG: NADH-quinone oxidoreductase subunit C [Thermogutta sp.]